MAFEGRKAINPSMYEVAAFEAVNNGLRSGDLYVVGSRRYQTFESYLRRREVRQVLVANGDAVSSQRVPNFGHVYGVPGDYRVGD